MTHRSTFGGYLYSRLHHAKYGGNVGDKGDYLLWFEFIWLIIIRVVELFSGNIIGFYFYLLLTYVFYLHSFFNNGKTENNEWYLPERMSLSSFRSLIRSVLLILSFCVCLCWFLFLFLYFWPCLYLFMFTFFITSADFVWLYNLLTLRLPFKICLLNFQKLWEMYKTIRIDFGRRLPLHMFFRKLHVGFCNVKRGVNNNGYKYAKILTMEDSRNIYLTNRTIAIYSIDKLKWIYITQKVYPQL